MTIEAVLLPSLGVVAIVVGFLLGRRRRPDIPSVAPRNTGRIVESTWLSEGEFEEFKRKNNLEQPRNPDLYSVWVRNGSIFVAAVSVKSGDRYSVSKVSTL